MTYEEAKKILDQIRCGEGRAFAPATIDCALYVTGDLALFARERSKGVDSPIPEEDWRGRCRERASMVAGPQRGHRKDSGRRGFAFVAEADGGTAC
jgi:hypothetical protein